MVIYAFLPAAWIAIQDYEQRVMAGAHLPSLKPLAWLELPRFDGRVGRRRVAAAIMFLSYLMGET
jgi:hypothetical protein